MFGLGWQELAIILVIIVMIFGAGKLPDVLKSLGQGAKEFKQEATAPTIAGDDAVAATNMMAGSQRIEAAAGSEEVSEGLVTGQSGAARGTSTSI